MKRVPRLAQFITETQALQLRRKFQAYSRLLTHGGQITIGNLRLEVILRRLTANQVPPCTGKNQYTVRRPCHERGAAFEALCMEARRADLAPIPLRRQPRQFGRLTKFDMSLVKKGASRPTQLGIE